MPVDDFWFLIFTQSQVNDDHCLGIWNFIHLSINIYIYIWNNGNQSHVFQEFPIAMFDCRGYLNVENADRDWESPRSSVAGGLITQMVQAAFERCCFEYRDG